MNPSKIQEAIAQGYSPDEVLDYLSKSTWQDKQDKISEARSQGYSSDEILGYLTQPKTGGILEAGIGGAKHLGASALTAIQTPFMSDEEAAARSVARQEAITEKPGFSLDQIKEAYKEGIIPGTVELAKEIPAGIAEQIPNYAAMLAGARTGAALTPPVLPIVGPFAKPLGAIAGAVAANYLPIAGGHLERQAQEQIASGKPIDINEAAAYGYAIPSSALDVGAMEFGLGKFLGLRKLGTETAEKAARETLEKAAKESVIKAGTIGFGKLATAEVPTEVMQQMFERLQADLPLTTPDAIKEYTDTAAQTLALGPLGSVARISERGEARNTLQADEQQRTQTLNRVEADRARIDQQVMDAKLENINAERDRINKIAEDAKTEGEMLQAKEAANTLYQSTINSLGNKAPEKSKIAKSIAAMEASFNKAIEQGDIDAQKKAIAELTNVPLKLINLVTMPNVITDQTFANMGIGHSATIRKDKILHGLDPQIPTENEQIRNVLNALLETKEKGSKQYEGIKNYLSSIPTTQELKGYTKDETTIGAGLGEGVKVSGQPVAGGLTAGIEGVDGTGLGSATDNVQQLAGREGPRPAPLAPESTEVLKTERKLAPAMGIQAVLKQNGGINTEHLFDLTGEKSVNKSGATVGLFTKNGRGLDDAVQVAVDNGYLNADVLNEVDGGVEALSDLIIDEIQGKKAVPLDRQADTELEAYLAREQRKADMQEVAPSEEELNKDVQEIAAEEKGKDVLFGPKIDTNTKEGIIRDSINRFKDAFKRHGMYGEGDWLERSYKYYYKKAMDQSISPEEAHKQALEKIVREAGGISVAADWSTDEGPKARALRKIDENIFERLKSHPEISKESINGLREIDNLYYDIIYQAKKESFKEFENKMLGKETEQGPTQQLGKRNPIFDKVTNAKELFKAVMKIADTRSDKAIINMLEKVPNLETVKVITENTSTDPELQGASGYFDPNTNTIFIDPRVTDLSHITLHEIAHAATDVEFDKHVKIVNNVSTPLTPLGKKIVKLFDAFMTESLKKQEGFYAQKNPKEFFMESYTDPKLKNFLQNRAGVLGLKPAQGKIATLWSDFVNLIKSMFGIPEYAHSMLDEILLLSPELMKGPGAITTGKEVSQARQAPEGITRPDGTPLKYFEADQDSLWQKTKNAYDNKRKWFDLLGNKIIGNRYSVERKGIDANLPEVDAFHEGKIRGDLINLQSTNGQSLAQSGLYHGRLDVRKSGMIIADESTGDRKVGMLDISKAWYELLDRATQDLGSKERAYDMLTAGWYGPRYADLEQYNQTVPKDEQIDISEWTESDKRTAAEAQRLYGDELKDIRDMRNIQRKDLLDFMVKSGLYTREKAQKYLDRMDYVALYRVPEEEIDSYDSVPIGRSAGLLGAGKEYRLVGSKRAAADPIDNYIQNMSWMMQRGIRNNAAVHTADMLQDVDQGKWYDRPATDIEKKANNIVTLYVDGKKKDFKVNDPNDMAAFMGSPVVAGFVWDIMKYPVSGLRHGITMMPQFVWNQANEDPIRATIASGNKAGFTRNYIDAWTSILNNQFKSDRTPNAELLNRYGIVGQKDVLDSQDVINMYKGKDKTGWKKYVLYLERMAQGSDLGAREAIFKNAVKELTDQGYDLETAQDYAAVRAHQYMPYQQVGTSRSLAYLRRMLPFINPPIQGLARDIAAARGRVGNISRADGKKALAWRLAKYTMFTAAYAAFMSGDDDYESKTDDQQDNNFFIGGTRVPVPAEIRPLKVAIERGTRAYINTPGADVDNPEIAAAIIRKFWEVAAGFAPIPTIARPIGENIANYDVFTGRPVVGPGQQRKEPAYQYSENTSEVAKVIGAQLNYSPIKIDHLIKGYGGYMGSTLAQMTNYLSSDRPAPPINQMLFIGSMLEGEHASGAKGDFYELYDKTSTVKATAQALKEAGDSEGLQNYMQENQGYLAVAPSVNNLHNQLTKLRQYKKQILASGMTPEEKREALDSLSDSENNMLSNIKDLHRQALEINNQN
jgi:hypothetical protein